MARGWRGVAARLRLPPAAPEWSRKDRWPPRCPGEATQQLDPTERSMPTTVAPGDEAEDQDVIGYALAGWDRTARLCAIRLAEAVPTVLSLIWLILRR